MAVSSPTGQERPLRFPLSRQRRKVWLISVIVLLISTAWFSPELDQSSDSLALKAWT